MSLEQRITRPCTIHLEVPSADRDELGNEESASADVETVCELQQMDRDENPEGVTETLWRIYFLPGETVTAGATVTVPGEGVFEIQGRPDRKRNPRTGEMRQVEATAREVSGVQEGGGS